MTQALLTKNSEDKTTADYSGLTTFDITHPNGNNKQTDNNKSIATAIVFQWSCVG